MIRLTDGHWERIRDHFPEEHIADSRTISLWLFGYYDGGLKNTVIDVASMQNSSRDLVRYCMDHTDALVMDAAKNVLGKANK